MPSSVAELLMREALARLTAAPNDWITVDSIKRKHLTKVTRRSAPQVHLIQGEEVPEGPPKGCRQAWYLDVTVAIFVTPDDETDTDGKSADPYKLEVYRRFSPNTAPAWTQKANIRCTGIQPEEEIADGDALRVDMRFRLSYVLAEWSLDTLAF